jgi:hypothetical protein
VSLGRSVVHDHHLPVVLVLLCPERLERLERSECLERLARVVVVL